MKVTLFVALTVAALVTMSCGGVVDPSNNQTENFSDTLQPGGSFTKTFSVSKSGEYSIAVTSTTPATTILGVGFGQVISGTCQPISLNSLAQVGHTGLAGAIQQGTWCAVIYDPGVLSAATQFQANVKHP